MRRIIAWLCALALCVSAMPCSRAEGWTVEEGEASALPDRPSQAGVLMREMTTEEKVWQLFLVAPEALTGDRYTTALGKTNIFSGKPVGGIVLFGQNIVSEKQFQKLTQDLQTQAAAAGAYAPFLAVSEEGGAYSRVANKLGYDQALAAPEIGLTRMAGNALAAGEQIGAYLQPFGINLDFAPVSDVYTAQDGWINGRLYGSDPQLVAQMAFQMAQGLRNKGIIPCFSHFPGQSSVNGNLNNREVVSTRTLEEMRGNDWAAFRLAADSFGEMMMVSHATIKAAGDGLPASLSPTVIGQWLRKELNYRGVVITDSLRMGAITSRFKSGQAAVQALKAGADLLLLPSDADAAVKAVLKAIDNGELTVERIDESVKRVLALKIEKGLIR